MDYFKQAITNVINGVPSIIYAILLLVLAFIVASVVKAIVVKVCKKLDVSKRFGKFSDNVSESDSKNSKDKDKNDLCNTFGKIAFVIVFVLFIPGILNMLNLQGVSQPITNMMNSLFSYITYIIGAIAIFIFGAFLAKIVKQIVVSLLKGFKFDKVQEKLGIKSDNATVSFSNLIGNIVYFLILIPVIIAALQVLNISSITTPAVNMLDNILSMVPNVFVAIVLIVVGVFIGKLVGSVLSAVLSGIGVNKFASNFIKEGEINGRKILFSDIIGGLVKYIIIILLAAQAVSVLKLDALNNLGTMVINYLPNFIGAVAILIAGLLLASFVEKLMKKSSAKSVVSAGIAKAVIIIVTVFMTLNQLNIASLIVNTTFIVILGTAAVACAIAFGIGGRETAANILKNIYESLNSKNNKDDKKDDGDK